jgi:hypothetical protein
MLQPFVPSTSGIPRHPQRNPPAPLAPTTSATRIHPPPTGTPLHRHLVKIHPSLLYALLVYASPSVLRCTIPLPTLPTNLPSTSLSPTALSTLLPSSPFPISSLHFAQFSPVFLLWVIFLNKFVKFWSCGFSCGEVLRVFSFVGFLVEKF